MEEVSFRDSKMFDEITDREKDEIEKNPEYMFGMYRARLRGIENLTQSAELIELRSELMIKQAYAQLLMLDV